MLDIILYIEPQERLSDYELGKAIKWIFYIAWFVGLIWYLGQVHEQKQKESIDEQKKKEKDESIDEQETSASNIGIEQNHFDDFAGIYTREEAEKQNDEILEAIHLNYAIWDSLNLAYQNQYTINSYVLDGNEEFLELILLSPENINLPFKEKMKIFKRAKLYSKDAYHGNKFNEIDLINIIGHTIKTQIVSIDQSTEEIIIKLFKN